MCPELWRLNDETSPVTQTSEKASSSSACNREVSSVTESTGGASGAVAARSNNGVSDMEAIVATARSEHAHQIDRIALLVIKPLNQLGAARSLPTLPFLLTQHAINWARACRQARGRIQARHGPAVIEHDA